VLLWSLAAGAALLLWIVGSLLLLIDRLSSRDGR
jgi:hypothetical protein